MTPPLYRLPGLVLISALVLAGCNQTLPKHSDENTGPEPATPSKRGGQRAVALASPSDPGKTRRPASASPAWEQSSSDESAAADSADLWDRIRAGFRLDRPSHPRIERAVEWYASHPEYLGRVQERARPYLRYIVDEVEARGMPTELVLLPVVESAFQPFAYSPGRAAGLWQFIPSTGEHFDLKQNWWYDGRRDVVASTEAALVYLQQLADRFDGDWELALAGYNAGAGTVSRAMKKNAGAGRPTDFWSLELPRETRDYVPRLLAISEIVENPERFEITLAPIADTPFLTQVDVESQLDLALAAEMADLKIDELYRLNPGFNRWATDPNGPHRLLLPVDNVEQFSNNLAELPADQRLRWNRYRIKRGDSLGAIARRHHTTVAALKEINGLESHRIRAGKHILIPVASQSMEDYPLSAGQRLAGLQNRERKGRKSYYTVRSGDSLWKISRRYGVNHKQLAKWNDLSPRDTLRPGSKLVIWSPTAQAGTSVSKIRPARLSAPIDTQSRVDYRVRSGDSLYVIARKFNVRVADLEKWNTLSGEYLQPGQKLRLYVDVAEQSL